MTNRCKALNDFTIPIFHFYELYRHYIKYNERLRMDHIHKANAFSMRFSLSMFTERWDLVFLCFQRGRIQHNFLSKWTYYASSLTTRNLCFTMFREEFYFRVLYELCVLVFSVQTVWFFFHICSVSDLSFPQICLLYTYIFIHIF